MNNYYRLVISGVARSGKNLMARSIIRFLTGKGISAKEYAFATELRKELNPLTTLNLGISAFTQDEAEKKIVRPLLMVWGTDIWRKLDENHWVKKIDAAIQNDAHPHIAVVSDGRFENEIKWAQKNGYVIHLERRQDGKIVPPNNSDEEKNDPIVKKLANFNHIWETFGEDFDNLGYYDTVNLLNKIFPPEQIQTWQQDFPIPT